MPSALASVPSASAPTTSSRNTQVNVDGRVYEAGQAVDVEEDTARRWLAAGWVVADDEAETKARRGAKDKAQ
jgi:hypothetical protein